MIWYSEVWLSIFTSIGFVGLVILVVALISAQVDLTAGFLGGGIMLMLLGMIVWTTYGYFLLGSADNNCASVPEMSGWQTLMIILVCIGSIPYLVLAIVILV